MSTPPSLPPLLIYSCKPPIDHDLSIYLQIDHPVPRLPYSEVGQDVHVVRFPSGNMSCGSYRSGGDLFAPK